MDTKLAEKLRKKYPNIVGKVGFECDNGWYWLLNHLLFQLQFNIDHNKDPQLQATQIKEKFGGLRFYVDHSNENQFATINFAEFLSYSICEKCGSIDNVTQTKGYIQSLCKKCRKGGRKK